MSPNNMSFSPQLEMLLREKMKTAYTELKKRFRDNDPEQKGNVSRLVTCVGIAMNEVSEYGQYIH